MRLIIDITKGKLIQDIDGDQRIYGLYSEEAFELISQQWIKVGWSQKYSYTFSWMGCPIIQLPEDIIRIQEVIYQVQPDVIIETGIAHGGSLIFYATLFKAMGKGRVIGIDIDIRPHNRQAIESHQLSSFISLIEGSSTAPDVVSLVKSYVKPGEIVIVILDSDHSKKHVLEELEAYHDFIMPGSYIIATDGIMKELHDVPRGKSEWVWNNPKAAAEEFVKTHDNFIIEEPAFPFNEGLITDRVTHWPSGFLRRIK